ncbi:Aldo/keto reductase family protein [compost metagenome]
MTAAQLALAWVINQGDFIVPIPGARKLDHLEQNAAAAGISLSAEESSRLAEALSPALVAGNRYTDASLALTNR